MFNYRIMLNYRTVVGFIGLVGTLSVSLSKAYPNVSPRYWQSIFWGSILLLTFSFLSFLYEYVVKPLRGKRYMWPIILVGLGVLSFGIGVIWYLIELPKSIAISPSSQPASTTIPGPQGPPGPPGPIGPPGPKSEIINQADVDIIKRQARLHLLKRELPRLEELKVNYEEQAQLRFNQLLSNQLPGRSITIGNILNIIQEYSVNIYKDKLQLHVIEGYDLNAPLQEEDQIKDNQKRYLYRKEKYTFLCNKKKIDNLLERIKKEIGDNDKLIDDYAKGIIRQSQ